MSTVSIVRVSGAGFDRILPGVVTLLRETVNGGAAMGFLAPLGEEEATAYWRSMRTELVAGSRILLTAEVRGRIVGCVQLVLASTPNGRHRAVLEKLMVAVASRGQRIGVALIEGAHATARKSDRRLIVLNTRRGSQAEGFYRALGYMDAGIVPGWSIGAHGERYDHVRMYTELPA